MSATAAGIGGIKTAQDLYKIAKELGWIGRLKNFWKKKRRILVLGSTGAGKTQFLDSMQKLIPDLIHHTTRTAYPNRKSFELDAASIFEFTDTPGQKLHGSLRLPAIKEAMKNADGVINVTAHGYHEWDVDRGEALTAKGEAKQSYLQRHREVEVEQLHEWNHLLSIGLRNPWLITVVTKADLWWDERDKVKAHYESGAYFKALGPAQGMRPSVCLYSSIRHRFFGTAPVSGFFDDQERLRLRANFFRVLFEAIGANR